MTWLKISDDFPDDCDDAELSDAAVRTHLELLSWRNRKLNAGEISPRRLAREARTADPAAAAAELVEAGWWVICERVHGWWLVHDMDHQPTRDQLVANREQTRQRVANWRAERKRNAVTEDGNAVGNGVTEGAQPPDQGVRDCNGVSNAGVTLLPVPEPEPEPVPEVPDAVASGRWRGDEEEEEEEEEEAPF